MIKTYVFDLSELSIPEKYNGILKNFIKFPLFYEIDNKGALIACGFITNGEKRIYHHWLDFVDELMDYGQWNKLSDEQVRLYYEEFLPAFEKACVSFARKKGGEAVG